MDREKFEDLKDVYALGALTEDERREFESYLAENPESQAEVDELSGIASILALAPGDREPPKSLRKNLMRTVNREARESGASTARSEGPFAAIFSYVRQRPLVLGAASVLVVGLFSWNVVLQGQVRDVRGDNTALRGQVASLSEQTAPVQSGTDRVLAMDAQGNMNAVRAEVVSYEDGQAVLVARNLPELQEGQTFQIWVLKDGQAASSGLFDPTSGEAPVATFVGNSISGADAVAVTVEPEGGSEQPTSTPELVTTL